MVVIVDVLSRVALRFGRSPPVAVHQNAVVKRPVVPPQSVLHRHQNVPLPDVQPLPRSVVLPRNAVLRDVFQI